MSDLSGIIAKNLLHRKGTWHKQPIYTIISDKLSTFGSQRVLVGF